MKGIILAGGSGTRLWPMTSSVSKQLLPVYDKPMIYYPLSTLISLGITEILIITAEDQQESFKTLLGNGSQFGISIEFKTQEKPNGLAEAFIIGEEFIGNSSVCLILGDNIFYGNFDYMSCVGLRNFATVVLTEVKDPERYGVAEFNGDELVAIVEKPENPPSNRAVTGLYFYPSDVSSRAKTLTPSVRGELEISDLNNLYIRSCSLDYLTLDKGTAWLDTGTTDSLMDASMFVKVIQERTGVMVGCPEQAAADQRLIDREEILEWSLPMKNDYGDYLRKMAKNY